jgi:hypothetical protein
MRAFLTGVGLVVAISVVAWLALGSLQEPSAAAYQIPANVRL